MLQTTDVVGFQRQHIERGVGMNQVELDWSDWLETASAST